VIASSLGFSAREWFFPPPVIDVMIQWLIRGMVGNDHRTKKTWEFEKTLAEKKRESLDILTCLSHAADRLTRRLWSLEVLRSHVHNLGIHDSDSN